MATISPNARNVRECPFCKELIAKSATRCPHCGQNVSVPVQRRKRPFWIGNFMIGFYAATALWLFLFYLYFR
jgi:predicted amidophosphoribosyltransferase